MNASQVMNGFTSTHCGWLLGGLILIGSGSSTVAFAQDVVAAGGGHSCAVLSGQLQCWGSNDYGQLGNGTTTASVMPKPVTGINGTITAIAAGSGHTCAVVDGGLKCWGANERGQLGTGNTNPSAVPVQVFPPGSAVTAVATSPSHTCAVVGGGLKCWGDNAYGQLGIGNIDPDPSPVPMNVFSPGAGVTSVAAGHSHSCAVTNGEVRCWGHNSNGQLGTNNYNDSPWPVVSGPITNAAGVAAGAAHSCALLNTGGAQCWGANGNGQLGNDTFAPSPVPVTVYAHLIAPPQPVPLSGATAITAGNYHTCATTSGAPYCWGFAGYGQLGVNSSEDSNFARSVDIGYPAAAVAAGGAHTCAVASGVAFCWGNNESGQLGNAAASPYVPVPALSITGFQRVSAGYRHGCATSAGGAYCWGWNSEGQLGTGTFANSAIPQGVSQLGPGSSVRLMAAGDYHSCAWMDTGVGVNCWGDNPYGQLGNNTSTDSTTPVVVAGLGNIESLSAGALHTCVARSDGGVQCWGNNAYGQLGNDTSDHSSVPVNVMIATFVPLSGATEVTSGRSHNCAVVNAGAFCWGLNVSGQLGNGSTDNSDRAAAVVGLSADSSVTKMSAGGSHTCAVVNEEVQCWGWNAAGQLGNAANDDSNTPVPVSGLDSGVASVASGGAHTCAVLDGGVQCWGDNAYGQLGDGSFLGSNVPVTALPPGSGIDKISAGGDYTCATSTATNTTWCWGNGMFGRLANGKLGYEDVPVEVAIFGNGFD